MLLSLFSFFLFLAFLSQQIPETKNPNLAKNTISDEGEIFKNKVHSIENILSETKISQLIKEAKTKNLKVSIAGKRHSMGGHSFQKGALVLNMTRFNKIYGLVDDGKTLELESGATWAEVQSFLNSKGLAVRAMQGPNIFSVGGSMSVNAHGWDTKMEQVSDSVQSFNLVDANGRILQLKRSDNKDLFNLVLGGFGLFGVITKLKIKVAKNFEYYRQEKLLETEKLLPVFKKEVLQNSKVELFYADLSIDPSSLLDEAIFTVYLNQKNKIVKTPLIKETNIKRDRLFLNLSRNYGWAKKLRWNLQKLLMKDLYISRNNAMRSPAERLKYYSSENVDILQEYFIPLEKFLEFKNGLKKRVKKHKANLLNCTIRFVRKSDSAFLGYAKQDSLAFVLYFNVRKNPQGQKQDKEFTKDLVNLAISLGGTFFLPYLPHYSKQQINKAYPEFEDFIGSKLNFDPEERFSNNFYLKFK